MQRQLNSFKVLAENESENVDKIKIVDIHLYPPIYLFCLWRNVSPKIEMTNTSSASFYSLNPWVNHLIFWIPKCLSLYNGDGWGGIWFLFSTNKVFMTPRSSITFLWTELSLTFHRKFSDNIYWIFPIRLYLLFAA